MSPLVVSLVTDPLARAAAYELRRRVFVLEQGVPLDLERDERDAGADHVLAVLAGEPVGTGRLVVESAGYEGLDRSAGPVGHLGRLAVIRAARGRGIGASLVSAIEGLAADRRLRCVYLGGQTHAVPFYEGLGYHVFGPEFDDAGLPHRHLVKVLSPSAARGRPAPDPRE